MFPVSELAWVPWLIGDLVVEGAGPAAPAPAVAREGPGSSSGLSGSGSPAALETALRRAEAAEGALASMTRRAEKAEKALAERGT